MQVTEKDDYRRRVMTGFLLETWSDCVTVVRDSQCVTPVPPNSSQTPFIQFSIPPFSAPLCSVPPVQSIIMVTVQLQYTNTMSVEYVQETTETVVSGEVSGTWQRISDLMSWRLQAVIDANSDMNKYLEDFFPSCPESPRWSILSLILYPSFELI